MPVPSADSSAAQRIDAALHEWRQGDTALDELWFVHVGDPDQPLTEAAAMAGSGGPQALESDSSGLVVVTQTCDIVRSCVERPYVEVSPLVVVPLEDLRNVESGRRPALAALPALRERGLVVDLDRVMTVEKSIVAEWQRTPGYSTDAEGRAFARALARKRARHAFPDDFTALARGLTKRLSEKHDKATEEGRALRALREIRVQASPGWGARRIELLFWFVRSDEDNPVEGKSWAEWLRAWLDRVPPSGRFVAVDGQVVTLGEMTGADYVGSDLLDLDHLSSRSAARDTDD